VNAEGFATGESHPFWFCLLASCIPTPLFGSARHQGVLDVGC